MAYDPTAQTGDVIDVLGDCATLMGYEMRWCCRDSVSGRGLRLHQTTALADRNGIPTHRTPREAVVSFLQREGVTAFTCRPSETVQP
ncbi:MAG: hypothetical protein IPH08_03760 [Rhodocyclaceae bacterium]|nr:hypothetical protein [Rhodocyclaceae bacterium]